jgi:agmatine/peptidylarginine deiminase
MTAPFLLPAEWQPQSAVQIIWPHPDMDWAPILSAAETSFSDIAVAVARRQPLLVVVRDSDHEARVRHLLRKADCPPANCRFALAASEDTWARDCGPLTVLGPHGPVLIDFEFNGWGGKFPSARDNALTLQLAEQGIFGDVPLIRPGRVLEGGAIESDGRGTLLLRSRCVIDERRNPGFGQARMEELLSHWLGAERFLWLEHGDLLGDDTDGHIDTLARFTESGAIVYQACDDTEDPHYEPLQAMAAALGRFESPDERPYDLIPLPLPAPIHDPEDGRRLPASYANFLVINGAVLAPVYDDPADTEAMKRLGATFPGREVLPIDCRSLIRQSGSLHCVTMQYPEGVLRASDTPR